METQGLVPMILGCSSVGRLGITVHITSGFGDIGFCGYWTLQLTYAKKVRICPGMKIGQMRQGQKPRHRGAPLDITSFYHCCFYKSGYILSIYNCHSCHSFMSAVDFGHNSQTPS